MTPIFVILNNSPILNKDKMNLKRILPAIAMLIAVITFGCKKDDNNVSVNPEVVSSAPANNTADIALNSKVSATFSVEMNPSSMTASNFTLQQGTSIVSGTVEYIDKTATFTPSANLVANVIYTATIKSGVTDLSGNTLTSDYVWDFTTSGVVDITNPTVTLTAPLNNATGVASNKVIAISFSENMDPSTINASTFTLMQGSTAVSGTVNYSAKTATFTPSSLMTAGAVYTANISVGAKDLAGNALATNTAVEFTISSSTA
ncbi:MAG TPA: Ig-like domain-containing protein, partial [Williamwhitmania sp.]|nr:Ig-like domain-containing protein [Williamwhitmania sp.]